MKSLKDKEAYLIREIGLLDRPLLSEERNRLRGLKENLSKVRAEIEKKKEEGQVKLF